MVKFLIKLKSSPREVVVPSSDTGRLLTFVNEVHQHDGLVVDNTFYPYHEICWITRIAE